MKKYGIIIAGIALIGGLLAFFWNPTRYSVALTEMTDAQYPDNPNLESRHSGAKQQLFSTVTINEGQNNQFDFALRSHEADYCTITLPNVPLLEWIPTASEPIKSDAYLTYIGVINQEWNRQQIQFKPGQFTVSGTSGVPITRVDLAQNCLNAYLWEALVYVKDTDGKEKLYWQGWFDFPHTLYARLFEARNNLPFDTFREGMENWIDPPSRPIALGTLRQVTAETDAVFESQNEAMYPLTGERERKRKNIICPRQVNSINDLLTDSTTFATFSIPGYYNTADPRKTELGRLGKLQRVIRRQTIGMARQPLTELELVFASPTKPGLQTRLVVGGFNPSDLPVLPPERVNESGWQMSMGVGNHSFYETFDYQQQHPVRTNPFYSFLLDQHGNWLDSHKVGIDGTSMHLDKNGKLNLWILSFERHAFVGHYQIALD
ncbi:hypothetical protein [Fibrella forsythiae]|uniref:DUF2931 family protein n=1 Tax=Fibrella forsythiae TaxID=2817061 RepID=A0ABS3JTP3_9BACT|nr:hypothetical protein [Fibrella forsythiae]MBO0952559.1 hypothetical protein [Fibrella forsythiae]